MTPTLLLALGLALGVDPRKLMVLTVAYLMPIVVLSGIGLLLAVTIRRTDPRAVLFCEGVSSELRSGASVRDAIKDSATALNADDLAIAATSRNLDELSRFAGQEFPGIGRELETVIARASDTGAAAAELFDEIGALALAQEEIRREVRVAAAPARAATALFVILPTGYLVSRSMSGGLGDLAASSGQRIMGSVGLAIFLFGLLIASFLVWRAR